MPALVAIVGFALVAIVGFLLLRVSGTEPEISRCWVICSAGYIMIQTYFCAWFLHVLRLHRGRRRVGGRRP